jgi:phosphoglycerate dehydrogenase-like enzyme
MKIVAFNKNFALVRNDFEEALRDVATIVWPTADDLAEAVKDADVLVSSTCPPALGEAGRRLRLVHAPAAGTENICVNSLPTGAIVANTFHHEDSIAEYVVSASVLLRRRILQQHNALQRDGWASPTYDPTLPWGDALGVATIGFVGFGHIGARTWDRFRAFGARGVAVTGRGNVDAAAHGLDWAGPSSELDRLLEQADVIVLSTPLTPNTTGMIGATQFARMKPTAVVVNVGRAQLIEEQALFEALRDGAIASAALDVWYFYPKQGSHASPAALPFRQLSNVLMTPHSSGLTPSTYRGRASDIASNIRRLVSGQPLVNVVALAP